jgi:TRAP-type uncharacterized transport system fused permease subunit
MSIARPRVATVLAFLLSVYALYWVVTIVDPYVYRFTFLLLTLTLTFLEFPRSRGVAVAKGEGAPSLAIAEGEGGPSLAEAKGTPSLFDYFWIALAAAALVWPLSDVEAFIYRAATPTTVVLVMGIAAILVVL